MRLLPLLLISPRYSGSQRGANIRCNTRNRQVSSSYVYRSEVIQTDKQADNLTDKQTPLKTSTSPRYAMCRWVKISC